MNKKILSTLLIISSILTVSLIFQPNYVAGAEFRLLFSNKQCPSGDVYQGDPVIFGATIYNNASDTFRVLSFRIDVYNDSEEKQGRNFKETDIVYEFPEDDVRYILAPEVSQTLYFQTNMSLRLDTNYTLQMFVLYIDVESQVETPNQFQIGGNLTLNVLYRREGAPNYIWVVFALLIVGILAFVVAAVVSWARERRDK